MRARDDGRQFLAGGDAGGWQALNADQRGWDARSGKPSLTVDEAAAYLTRAGLSWSGALGQAAVVNFAFRATSGPLPLDVSGFSQFTAAQIQATLLALQSWSDVAQITFVRQGGAGYSDNAALLFGNYADGADGAAAFASLPGSTAAGDAAGDVWVNSSLSYNATPQLWGYGQLTLVHEIGHAIGLLHPGDYNAQPGVEITYQQHAEYYEDSGQYTVMSYFSEQRTDAGFGSGRYAAAPLLDDIAAAQRLYGANMTTRTGDTVYGFNSNADRPWFTATAGQVAPVFAVWDAGGSDTLDFSGYGDRQVIDLRQGGFSDIGGLRGNVAIAVGAVIENAVGGSGDDRMFGNSADNRLTPGGGQNYVNGGLGSDTVVFSGRMADYTISWRGNEGFVSGAEGAFTLVNVEFLAFSDRTASAHPRGGLDVSGDITDDLMLGSEFGDYLSGSDGDDEIFGLAGGDQLVGGRGNDLVDGGADNDHIYASLGDDELRGGEGVDRLDVGMALAGVVIDLAAGTLTGGGLGDDRISGFEGITGSRFTDLIRGDAADNDINGFGDADVLYGEAGDDTLRGSWEEAGGAPDLIKGAGQANRSLARAISLDDHFDRLAHEGVPQEFQPHATVHATTHGGFEFYAFTAGANAHVVFDIDGASFDTVLRVFDANGTVLAASDDGTYTGDGGPRTDSYFSHRFAEAGVYYVQVGRYLSGSGPTLRSDAPPAGETYTLHVVAPGHAVQPTYAQGSELHGGVGDDVLWADVGDDVLDGGSGDDMIYAQSGRDVIRGGDGWDVLHLRDFAADLRLVRLDEDEFLLKGADGADRISGVEIIHFGDGATLDLARLHAGDGRGWGSGVSVAELIAWQGGGADAPQVQPPAVDKPLVEGWDQPQVMPPGLEPLFEPPPPGGWPRTVADAELILPGGAPGWADHRDALLV